MIKKVNLCAALTGLALCTIQMAMANSLVTFQVDMSLQTSFAPPTDKVYAYGAFNNWASGFQLTNDPAGANTNLYSGTLNVTTPANGAVLDYKFVTLNGGFENTAQGPNRCVTLPTTSGAGVVVPYCFFNDGTSGTAYFPNITFQVDMSQQIALGNFVTGDPNNQLYVQGTYLNWSDDNAHLLSPDTSILRTNNSGLVTSNVYTVTLNYPVTQGMPEEYKFVIHNGGGDHYESPTTGDPDNTQNRFFAGPTTDLVLPVVFFSDAPFNPIATNHVTFQVDMTDQALNHGFDPAVTQVNVVGSFNNWTDNVNVLTNNPGSTNTNVYIGTFTIIDGVGATEFYKFRTGPIGANNTDPGAGYEGLANNRSFVQPNTNAMTLPVVYWADVVPVLPNPNDFLTNSVTVTFTVDMTGAVDINSLVWDPSMGVYINGSFIPWLAWSASTLPQMTQTPPGTGSLYTFTTNLPAGKAVQVDYLYSMDGSPDETTGANHVRYIRSYGTYNFPLDHFGGTPVVEPSFGNLAVGKPSGGSIPITWLGRPGVHLQGADSLGGTWTNIPGTDAQSAASLPFTGNGHYYRLVHPLQ